MVFEGIFSHGFLLEYQNAMRKSGVANLWLASQALLMNYSADFQVKHYRNHSVKNNLQKKSLWILIYIFYGTCAGFRCWSPSHLRIGLREGPAPLLLLD